MSHFYTDPEECSILIVCMCMYTRSFTFLHSMSRNVKFFMQLITNVPVTCLGHIVPGMTKLHLSKFLSWTVHLECLATT